jgi:PAS domain S-box-containing protein
MKAATQTGESRGSSEPRVITRTVQRLVRWINDLSFAEKLYTVVALLVVVMILLLVMAIQSVRLQSSYRNLEASSFRAATDIGRVNALIYAVVMDSRGIYMSTDRAKVREFADSLLKRNHELSIAALELEHTVGNSDPEQFLAFKERILQFVDFREELVRRALVIGPAAGRAWGDNDANRTLRRRLNADLEAFAALYRERASKAAELGDLGLYACWYLFGLGLLGLSIAAINLLIVRRSVIGPLSGIIRLAHRMAGGDIKAEIPYFGRRDEIGRLAVVLRHFRDAVESSQDSEQRELATAAQRDAAIEERDRYSDRYLETKWQLHAAVDSMPQGMIMLDSKANVLVINDRYRQMYALPATIKPGSSLQDLLQYGIDSGQFAGDGASHAATILERIEKRKPMSGEVMRHDRIIHIQENSFDGGGWVAMHEDITERYHRQRILKRTEHFLATLIENIPEGIVAKDARNLRYVFVNKAAETMIGLPRAEMVGKTARELFAAETAELIETRDRQLIAQKQQLETIVDTVVNPRKGLRRIAWRRLQIGGPNDESHLFVSMFEDWTDRDRIAAAS